MPSTRNFPQKPFLNHWRRLLIDLGAPCSAELTFLLQQSCPRATRLAIACTDDGGCAMQNSEWDSEESCREATFYFLPLNRLTFRWFDLSGKKKNPNQNFLVRISSGGVGVFHVRGGRQKVRYVLRNPGKANFLAGYPGICAGIYRGCPKGLRKKGLCSILVP